MFVVCHTRAPTGRNETPFGRYICVVPSNVILHRGPGPHGEILGVGTPSLQQCHLSPITLALVIIITHADVVAGIGCLSAQHVCVCVC